jgi:hypothetical protein
LLAKNGETGTLFGKDVNEEKLSELNRHNVPITSEQDNLLGCTVNNDTNAIKLAEIWKAFNEVNGYRMPRTKGDRKRTKKTVRLVPRGLSECRNNGSRDRDKGGDGSHHCQLSDSRSGGGGRDCGSWGRCHGNRGDLGDCWEGRRHCCCHCRRGSSRGGGVGSGDAGHWMLVWQHG